MSGCGCGGGTIGATKTLAFHLGPQPAAPPSPTLVAAENEAKAAGPVKAPAPASSGPSTGVLVVGGVAAVAAIAGIAYVATR